MMAQTRPVTAPASDAGAVGAAAGTYLLEATQANMDCAGTKYSYPTSGLFGVVAGTVTFAVGVGPSPAAGVTKLDGASLTTVAGPDMYSYKKR